MIWEFHGGSMVKTLCFHCWGLGLISSWGTKIPQAVLCARVSKHVCASCLVTSNSLQPRGLQPARLLCPWNFPGKNTGVVAISSSRGFSWPRGQTHISCIGRQILYYCTTWESPQAIYYGQKHKRKKKILWSTGGLFNTGTSICGRVRTECHIIPLRTFLFSIKKNFIFIIIIFWLCLVTCGILVPRPGIEPMPLTTGLPGNSLELLKIFI